MGSLEDFLRINREARFPEMWFRVVVVPSRPGSSAETAVKASPGGSRTNYGFGPAAKMSLRVN